MLRARQTIRLFTLLKNLFASWNDARIFISAGHLTYVSTMSLVPLGTVMFGVLSFFPFYNNARSEMEAFVFRNFVPAASDIVQHYIGDFISNSRKMTTIGLVFLVFTSLMLIANIDAAIMRIWRIHKARPLLSSFALYWLILTIGPLLIGASLAVSSYLIGLQLAVAPALSTSVTHLIKISPFPLSLLTFLLIYMLVPNTKVPIRFAAIGALVAALLFEGGKSLFSLWVTHFPAYEAIYGALAAVPLLLFWMYLSWGFVLFGAYVTANLPEAIEKSKNEYRQGASLRSHKKNGISRVAHRHSVLNKRRYMYRVRNHK
jgi:membrane protein